MEKKLKIILIGAGGHSKSVSESLSPDLEVVGYIDENKEGFYCGKRILGKSIVDVKNYEDYYYFVTIGDNESRKQWFLSIQKLGLKTINIVDKSANISKKIVMGTGNFVGKGVIINSDVIIGDNNILNTRCIVEHECRIGNHTHISTNAVINGNVEVGDGVFLGSSSVVIGQIKIESNSIVGAGSVVIRDVEKNSVCVGVPAKKIKSV